jgi:hypothetical protein
MRLVTIPLVPVEWSLSGFAFGRLVTAESRILVGSINAWWLWSGFGLWVASVFSPLPVVREYLLVFLWLWPILAWSQLGVREQMHRVAPVLFSSPRPVRRQLLASWLSGTIISVFMGTPAMLRFASVGRADVAAAVLGAALFVPSLALFLGVASRASRMFEIVYLALWYVGPLSKAPAVDFLGSTDAALQMGVPTVCAALTGALLIAALGLRSWQLRD